MRTILEAAEATYGLEAQIMTPYAAQASRPQMCERVNFAVL